MQHVSSMQIFKKKFYQGSDLNANATYNTRHMHTNTLTMLILPNKPHSLGTGVGWWQKRFRQNGNTKKRMDANYGVPHTHATIALSSPLHSHFLCCFYTPHFTHLPPNTPQQNPSCSSQERWHTLRMNLEMRSSPRPGTKKRKEETTHTYVWSHIPVSHHNVSTYRYLETKHENVNDRFNRAAAYNLTYITVLNVEKNS